MKRLLILLIFSMFLLASCSEGEMTLDYPSNPFQEDTSEAEDEQKKTEESSDLLQGEVIRIIDGDTMVAKVEGYDDEQRIRLVLVNTPEICHEHDDRSCQPEPFGNKAKKRSSELLSPGTNLSLERDVSETDPYDRLLFYVYLEDGRMLQEILLKEGLAEVKPYPPDITYEERLTEIESLAKEKNIGIWSD